MRLFGKSMLFEQSQNVVHLQSDIQSKQLTNQSWIRHLQQLEWEERTQLARKSGRQGIANEFSDGKEEMRSGLEIGNVNAACLTSDDVERTDHPIYERGKKGKIHRFGLKWRFVQHREHENEISGIGRE
jgi:hypothetical protein